MKKLENKWLLACLAFLVPAVLLLIIFALNGVTPFGGKSLAEQDANIQYIEFFNYYRNLFHGKDTLLYSFTNFLGGSGVALAAYYLASPFNFLILAVPASMNHALFEANAPPSGIPPPNLLSMEFHHFRVIKLARAEIR